MRVLNIDVGADLVARWVHWFAPGVQPFLAEAELAARVDDRTPDARLSDEVRDTYCLYGLPAGVQYVWLDEARFLRLPRTDRAALVRAQRQLGREGIPSVRRWRALVGDAARAQADGHRFVWWRSLMAGCEERVLSDYVEDGRRPSRHDEVPDDVWGALEDRLPSARRLAGTFPAASGPNCFGRSWLRPASTEPTTCGC